MNTQATPKPALKITIQNIGPIISLDGTLSNNKQNLIFARNGTGKSFLARSLRLLDENSLEGIRREEIAERLVSEEALSGRGTFSLWEDTTCIGKIELNRTAGSVSFSAPKYLFHVFSEDYVDLHLRQKRFELDGNIDHEIIVGQENLAIDAKEAEKAEKDSALASARDNLNKEFEAQKQKLRADFQINSALGSFKSLNPGVYFEDSPFSGSQPPKAASELLASYNKFKSLPSDPKLPVGPVPDGLRLDWAAFEAALARVTSPSSVAEDVKRKIAEDPDFFRSGLRLQETADNDCPFCTQTLSEAGLLAISRYQEYFDDAEAKEKDSLAALQRDVTTVKANLATLRTQHLSAKSHFDDLKAYFPSAQDKEVEDIDPILDGIDNALKGLHAALAAKLEKLAVPQSMPEGDIARQLEILVEHCRQNAALYQEISDLAGNSKNERLALQNDGCAAMRWEFGNSNATEISSVRQMALQSIRLAKEITELRRTQGDKADARTRVAETFSLLLRRFFGQRYTFDADTFKVLREQKSMARGGDRTLSDGEKSVMAFCYFLAQSHLKVQSNDDYSRLYFVFDDPVTSMSFDYVYTIVQTLKLLRISAAGEVEFNPKSGNPRPRMLVLTHNNYFYNVASSNRAIQKDGLFQLVPGASQHSFVSQKGFATPHLQQLKHVFDVSRGQIDPDFMTPNCIRSVVESMWKFCRPDLDEFGKFCDLIINEYGIELKSVLMNDLSHGGKFDDPPPKADDIVEASKEAIAVVDRFAGGQLKWL